MQLWGYRCCGAHVRKLRNTEARLKEMALTQNSDYWTQKKRKMTAEVQQKREAFFLGGAISLKENF